MLSLVIDPPEGPSLSGSLRVRSGEIARQLVRRDDRGPYFDWFGVFIDTNLDRRTGYGFQVNASGVRWAQRPVTSGAGSA